MDNVKLKKKTLLVIIVTVITMFAEIYFGIITNSMGLTADGFHMGTHAIALLITFIICSITVKEINRREKLNALGGYTSAILLGLTSLGILLESIKRFFNPLSISFTEAIIVATIGLVVNFICILIMDEKEGHNHNHNHNYNHIDKDTDDCKTKEENLNYKGAYLHILADLLTSIIAILALVAGKYFNIMIFDPIIGIIGGIIIAKWAFDLIRKSGKILLS